MFTLEQLANKFGAEVIGDSNCVVSRVATLQHAQSGDISFLSNPIYKKYLSSTQASAVIINKEHQAELKTNGLLADNPYLLYAKITKLLYGRTEIKSGRHPSAVVDDNCNISETAWIGANCVIASGVNLGERVFVGPGCVLEEGVHINDDSYLVANVTVCHGCKIGSRSLIHPGTVIGSDGFGLAKEDGVWIKIPQIGSVHVGDDVEIGANCAIDRGAIDDTVIENGVKLDNLIQIAHNVHIGVNTAIAGCTGIAGSTKIGKNCAIGGMVGIVGHLEIADNVSITATSFVGQSIKKAGLYSSGFSVLDNKEWNKTVARVKQLKKLTDQVKQLEQQIENLTKPND